jgi:large subunit ribosomal protein L31
MKSDIHPTYNPVVFVDVTSGKEFITKSTKSSKEKRDIDGVEHSVISIEVSADSHPFWTGKVHHVDAAGRIERFKNKFGTNVDTGKRKTVKKVVRKSED